MADPTGDKLDKLIAGITSVVARQDAAEEKEKEKEKADKAKADGMSEFMDSFKKRMDAWEEDGKKDRARLDAACAKLDAMSKKDEESEEEKKAKADKAKKDAEEAEEKAKKDAAEAEEKAKKDAANGTSALLARLAALEAVPKPVVIADAERVALVDAQVKANPVYQAFGDSGAPTYLNGETRAQYIARLASKWKEHSRDWKAVDLNALPEAALDVAAARIYADALAEANHPTKVRPGVMIAQRTRDASGREITRYTGDPNACWDQFNPPTRHVRRILTPGSSRAQ